MMLETNDTTANIGLKTFRGDLTEQLKVTSFKKAHKKERPLFEKEKRRVDKMLRRKK